MSKLRRAVYIQVRRAASVGGAVCFRQPLSADRRLACPSAAESDASWSLERDLVSNSLCPLQRAVIARRFAKHRWRFLFRSLVGVLHHPGRQRRRSGDFFFPQSMDWTPVASEEIASKCDPGGPGACGRTRGLEDYLTQPVTPALPNQLAQLSLWPDHDPISHLHSVGGNWTGTRLIPVCLRRDLGSTWLELDSWKKSSSNHRILGMGWRITAGGCRFGAIGSDFIASLAGGGRKSRFG